MVGWVDFGGQQITIKKHQETNRGSYIFYIMYQTKTNTASNLKGTKRVAKKEKQTD